MKIAPHFEASLADFDLEKLDQSEDIIYGVDDDLRLAFLNEQWMMIALENDADPSFFSNWGIGSEVDKALGDDLASFYLDKFEHTKQTGETWEHEYLCPAPSVIRKYQMRVLPLTPEGWLVVHTKIVEQPRSDDGERLPLADSYCDEHDLYHQCSHCGRFRRPDTEEGWDWVPALFEDPPDRTSHGLCETCFQYYYGEAG